MPPKFLLPLSSPLRGAVRHLLLAAQVPSGDIADASSGQHFVTTAVASSDGTTTAQLTGLAAAFRVAAVSDAASALFGATPADRALVGQWTQAAQQVCSGAVDLASMESLVPSHQEYLAGGRDTATAADVLFFAACRVAANPQASLNAASPAAVAIPPTSVIAKWVAFVQRHAPMIQSLLEAAPEYRGAEASGEAVGAKGGKKASGGGAGAKGEKGSGGFTIPNAEEIERRRLEKEKAKAAAKAAAAAAPAPAAAPPAAPGHTGLDIRVGRITDIDQHPKADKLFVEQIDLGGGEVRTIVSGLVGHYQAADLKGRLVLVLANLKPKPLMGVASHGMVLCASETTADSRVVVVSPGEESGAKPGDSVVFGGAAAAPPAQPVAVPSGSKLKDIMGSLRTDGCGLVHWGTECAFVAGASIAVPGKLDAPVK